eukprot:gnl/MRDRNA2_/MRDRNA2_115652_c0_seq1.p1 gnl/MRDRNA2_/MRDRNA2_115652_c0~~gnl/MRDRNA2_/MRDRNA2_115652_c0_seq1.p1  ORF type:complete len:482 (-),score=77.49 gnl/MRDRNA2_/MRDRNA2_115652_c0_seq1:26-1471(-)
MSIFGFLSRAIAQANNKKGLAIVSGTVVLAFLRWRRMKREKNLPPGSLGLPLLGELAYFKDPSKFVSMRLKQYGGTFKTRTFFKNTVMLAPTEANAKLFFSKKELGWPDHWRTCIGEASLPMINDPVHKRIRTLNGRAFTDAMLDSYLPVVQQLTEKHLRVWASSSQDLGGASQDFYMHVKKYTFDLAQSVILGVQIPLERLDPLMKVFDTVISGLMSLPINLPGFHWRKVLKARAELVQEFQKVIDARREQLKSGEKPTSMLDSMIVADGINSDVELQDFCLAMTFAGHDTTNCTMQDVLYWIKKVPGLEKELREEVYSAWDGVSTITRSHLKSIPKCWAFMQEIWRLNPPVGGVLRTLHEDTVVDGYDIPRGWVLSINLSSISNKVPDPEEFRISRYLDQKGGFIDKTTDTANYGIFGGGSRMCIGYKFAKDETLIFLLHLLKFYDWTITSAKNIKLPFNYWRVEGTFMQANYSKAVGA